MAVQPTQPDRIGNRPGTGRARRTLGEAPDQLKGDRTLRPQRQPDEDSIEISTTAEMVMRMPPDILPQDELPPERLHLLLKRISTDFYQRPEVRAEVARKIAQASGLS